MTKFYVAETVIISVIFTLTVSYCYYLATTVSLSLHKSLSLHNLAAYVRTGALYVSFDAAVDRVLTLLLGCDAHNADTKLYKSDDDTCYSVDSVRLAISKPYLLIRQGDAVDD